MILEIDMGNTRLKWRLRTSSTRLAAGYLSADADFEALHGVIDGYVDRPTRVLVASVRSAGDEFEFTQWVRANLAVEPEFARSMPACAEVINGYDDPGLLGVDRWLSIVAAYAYFRTSCVVVSAGTALTVDLVSHQGVHLGGYIAPGMEMFMAVLQQSTAKIRLGKYSRNVLDLSPGKATGAAIANAGAVMMRGIIDHALACVRNADGCEQAGLLLTGGDAVRLQELYPGAHYKQELVLDGLSHVFGLQPIK